MEWNDSLLERYSRQLVLPFWDIADQETLATKSVAIVGLGALGNPAALYLTACGVGKLGLIDQDTIALSNLQRQILYSTASCGKSKINTAKQRLNELNEHTQIETVNQFITQENKDILQEYDFILDCTDKAETKFLLNDICVALNKPLSHAGVLQAHGQVMTIIPKKTACYRCVFPETTNLASLPTCSQAGVFSPIAGIIGTIQATEALKYLLTKGDLLTNRLLSIDILSFQIHKLALQKQENCICS